MSCPPPYVYWPERDYPGSGTRWVTFADPSTAMFFPSLPACYVIYLEGKLSYVGQTSDMYKRMLTYKLKPSIGGGTFSTFGSYTTVIKVRFSTCYGDWLMREARLIRRLQPPLNRLGVKRAHG